MFHHLPLGRRLWKMIDMGGAKNHQDFEDKRVYKVGITYHLGFKSLVDEGIVFVNHDNIDIKEDHGIDFLPCCHDEMLKKALDLLDKEKDRKCAPLNYEGPEQRNVMNLKENDRKRAPLNYVESGKDSKRTQLKNVGNMMNLMNQKVKKQRKVGASGSVSSKCKAEKLNDTKGNIKGMKTMDSFFNKK